MFFHKPTVVFDGPTKIATLARLKEFVTERGLVEDEASFARRRPRTCIITMSQSTGIHLVDQVWVVSRDSGITPTETHLVTDDLLA